MFLNEIGCYICNIPFIGSLLRKVDVFLITALIVWRCESVHSLHWTWFLCMLGLRLLLLSRGNGRENLAYLNILVDMHTHLRGRHTLNDGSWDIICGCCSPYCWRSFTIIILEKSFIYIIYWVRQLSWLSMLRDRGCWERVTFFVQSHH